MSNIGRVVVAKTSNAEYIVGVNGVENIVSFEPDVLKTVICFSFCNKHGNKSDDFHPWSVLALKRKVRGID